MKLSEFTHHLSKLENFAFELPSGELVPEHFHVTEIGKVKKEFIDCGGTLRDELKISFQLWNANDYNHRLRPDKLIGIIELAKTKLELPDAEIEIEYQGTSIEKYEVGFNGKNFLMLNTQTNCLAKDKCEIPAKKPRVRLSQLQNSCTPDSGCC